MLNTPQDYEGEPPPVLSNGTSAGDIDVMSDVDQKYKEDLSHHRDLHDLNDAIDVLDSKAKDGKPQHHWSAPRTVFNEPGACGGEA